jgi:hypothetical protein
VPDRGSDPGDRQGFELQGDGGELTAHESPIKGCWLSECDALPTGLTDVACGPLSSIRLPDRQVMDLLGGGSGDFLGRTFLPDID